MLRLILLTAASFIIFIGIGAIYFLDGSLSIFVSLISIFTGSIALWYVERKTVHHLDEPGFFNDLLNAGEHDPGP